MNEPKEATRQWGELTDEESRIEEQEIEDDVYRGFYELTEGADFSK